MEKMNKVQKFEAIKTAVEGLDFQFDVVEFLDHEIDLLNRKSANKKPSKSQVENEDIKSDIVDVLSGENPMTATEIMNALQSFNGRTGITVQKVSALLSQMVKTGEVNKVTDKKKSYFSVATD